jgi:signal transduction histidine kinase
VSGPRRFVFAVAPLSAVLLLLNLVFVVVAPHPVAIVTTLLVFAVAPLCIGLGAVLALRPTASRVGALLTFVGFTVSLTGVRETGAYVLAGRPADAAALAWVVALLAEVAWWVLVAVALFLLHFPDGRVPGPRWRWLPIVAVAGAALVQLNGALERIPFRPPLQDLARPFPPPPIWLEALGAAAFLATLAAALASAVSVVQRYRRGSAVARAQIKWLAIGGLGVVLYPFVCLAEIVVTGGPGWISALVGVSGLVGIPAATAIAILRHDLYDVDRAIAGTVAWGVLSAALIAVYAVTLVVTGVVIGRDSPLAAAGATAVAALGLSPLRQRLQRAVDRRLYPRRRAAFEALDALYRDASAGRAQPEALQAVLRTALRDDGLVVGYRVPGSEEFVGPAGRHVASDGAIPIELDGEAIGVVVPTDIGDSRAASADLLREVARRSTALVEVVRLRLALSQALREAEASRARLVHVGYEERRRLERDLHDGAQQRLVSLGMAIRVAQRHLGDGTVDVRGLLDESVEQLSAAVAELRQLAHGIRPSSLDDGLEAAVAHLVQSIPVTVEADVVAGRLPDDVATTAYFVISEAVTNAVKHASANRIGLHVARADGRLVVRVSDDGRGGAKVLPGSAIADRVAALGGSLAVESPIGRGTIIEAALPCAS